jgi:hypothetical protein
MYFLKQFCEIILLKNAITLKQTNPEINRYMTLEISWLMANIAYGPAEIIFELFFDLNQQTYN